MPLTVFRSKELFHWFLTCVTKSTGFYHASAELYGLLMARDTWLTLVYDERIWWPSIWADTEWPLRYRNFYWTRCHMVRLHRLSCRTFAQEPKAKHKLLFWTFGFYWLSAAEQVTRTNFYLLASWNRPGRFTDFPHHDKDVGWLSMLARRFYWLLLRNERLCWLLIRGEVSLTLYDGLRAFSDFHTARLYPASTHGILTLDSGVMLSGSTNLWLRFRKTTKTFTGFWFGWTRW